MLGNWYPQLEGKADISRTQNEEKDVMKILTAYWNQEKEKSYWPNYRTWEDGWQVKNENGYNAALAAMLFLGQDSLIKFIPPQSALEFGVFVLPRLLVTSRQDIQSALLFNP